jgi:hypothetical protein
MVSCLVGGMKKARQNVQSAYPMPIASMTANTQISTVTVFTRLEGLLVKRRAWGEFGI